MSGAGAEAADSRTAGRREGGGAESVLILPLPSLGVFPNP